MATFEFDGTTFDLDHAFADVTGVEWKWSGRWTAAREPLMETSSGFMSLPDVYLLHGPLISLPTRVTRQQIRAVLGADFLASQSAGYVESPESWAGRVFGGAA